MNIVEGRNWQSFLLFYGIAFFIFISMDPGIINWFQSLHYDLHEGEFPLLRILALLASSIIVATPIIIPIRLVQLVYIAGLAVLNIIGLSFRFILDHLRLFQLPKSTVRLFKARLGITIHLL